MQVRLAFSVAIHANREILLMDEVLAVGDQHFQKKALKKIESLLGEKRTVLFVSHDLGILSKLCTRLIWLDKGRLVADGPTEEILSLYRT